MTRAGIFGPWEVARARRDVNARFVIAQMFWFGKWGVGRKKPAGRAGFVWRSGGLCWSILGLGLRGDWEGLVNVNEFPLAFDLDKNVGVRIVACEGSAIFAVGGGIVKVGRHYHVRC